VKYDHATPPIRDLTRLSGMWQRKFLSWNRPLILSYTSNYQLSRSKAKFTPNMRRIIQRGTCGPVCTRMTIRWQSPPQFRTSWYHRHRR